MATLKHVRLAVALLGIMLMAGPARGDLVAHWAFDSVDSGQVADSTSNNNTGVLGGTGTGNTGPDLVAGVLGNALDFDGADIVTVADSASLDSTTGREQERTLAYWFKTTELSNKVVTEKKSNQHFVTQMNARKMSWRTGSGAGADSVWSDNNVNDDTWHHFVGVARDDDPALPTNYLNMYMFIDGVLQESLNLRDPPTRQCMTYLDNDDPFVIGARAGIVAGYPGKLDDVAVWNDPLTDGKAIALFSLAEEPNLEYDVSLSQQLFNVYDDAGSSRATIDNRTWEYVAGLSSNFGLGQVENIGSFYYLRLDDNGAGVQTVPEPAGLLLLALGALILGSRLRRRILPRPG